MSGLNLQDSISITTGSGALARVTFPPISNLKRFLRLTVYGQDASSSSTHMMCRVRLGAPGGTANAGVAMTKQRTLDTESPQSTSATFSASGTETGTQIGTTISCPPNGNKIGDWLEIPGGQQATIWTEFTTGTAKFLIVYEVSE